MEILVLEGIIRSMDEQELNPDYRYVIGLWWNVKSEENPAFLIMRFGANLYGSSTLSLVLFLFLSGTVCAKFEVISTYYIMNCHG